MTHIAIIPARQNSKGVSLKNLRTVGGISLVGRAILAAQDSCCFDRIIVSSDGEAILTEAEHYGAESLLRPDALSGDTASSISCVLHALENLNIQNGSITLLQPTSPLRTARHIHEAFEQFIDNSCGTVVSVCPTEHHPYKTLLKIGAHYQAIHQLSDLEQPRQQLPYAYRPNGAIYINTISNILKYQRFFIEPLSLYEMNPQESIDIDCEQDLLFAEQYLHSKS